MATPNVGAWVRMGLLALPLYGLLTLWTTFIHQPDPNTRLRSLRPVRQHHELPSGPLIR
jgi:hypothetical protein